MLEFIRDGKVTGSKAVIITRLNLVATAEIYVRNTSEPLFLVNWAYRLPSIVYLYRMWTYCIGSDSNDLLEEFLFNWN